MAVPLHRLDEDRQQRPQPFAADPVGCLPDHVAGRPGDWALWAAARRRVYDHAVREALIDPTPGGDSNAPPVGAFGSDQAQRVGAHV